MGKDTRWRDIDTTNTVLARCYGLRKVHKENYPLRLDVLTINTPTRFLEENFNMILQNSLSKSSYTVKNNWYYQKIIVTKTIPDGHVMISLNVVAIFPNIPLDLVKKTVSNRWIKVKLHTKLDKKSARFAGTFSLRASLSAPRARDSMVALRAPFFMDLALRARSCALRIHLSLFLII